MLFSSCATLLRPAVRTAPFITLLAFAPLASAIACASDDGALGESDVSGFLSDAKNDDGGPDDGVESWGEGEYRGILTFSFYPADALTGIDQIGIAGAWHTDEALIEEIDDFYAVFALQTKFPLPPEDEDELEQNDIPGGFDWGDRDAWFQAGNAFKLATDEVEILACLLQVGTALDLFPVYAATQSSSVEGCVPEPADWVPGADYDLVMYGGDLFPTQVLLGPVEAPQELTVEAPDFAAYNAEIMQGEALDIEWSGEGGSRDRLIIRVWDDMGRMFTINAADDGEYEIPSDALGVLEPGPITITVARERVERIPFPQGGVKTVTRYERRGYFDLIAGAM